MEFSPEVLSVLKSKVTESSGAILMFLKSNYPKPYLQSTLISKTGLSQYVGKIAFERLVAAGLIDHDEDTPGFVMYQLSENGFNMLELIAQGKI
ncbi:hypothetical protein [Desulfitobacterium sp. AusDCA]|uniref:hypothetical protein n=1 Tax=Desulfitobacterium sp. AusDCA TaxID=3240383 RepID=UPI003DA6D218